MRKALLIVIAAVATTLVSATSVAAATPDRFSFDNGFVSFVDTEVCRTPAWTGAQFDVNATEHEYGFVDVFFNIDGSFAKAIVHNNYDATISANGKTIVERDTWTTTFYPDGSRDIGLTVHIQGSGGIVVRDAGQIVRDATGNVLYIVGPHQQFSDVSFCPALAP
jgi:hypothetical protein